MAGIGPIGGGAGFNAYSAAQATAKPAQPTSQFEELLGKAVGAVNEQQQASSTAVQNLLAGGSEDVLPVVTAMAKADLSFKLLLGVRNKVIEAYKQTMNMQV